MPVCLLRDIELESSLFVIVNGYNNGLRFLTICPVVHLDKEFATLYKS